MRKQDEKEARTPAEPRRGARERSESPRTALGGYQEGSVESVGGGPSGTDKSDRTGQAGSAPAVERAAERDATRDAFTSSEVAEASAGAPGRPERTRG
jgi:hypothetical protein